MSTPVLASSPTQVERSGPPVAGKDRLATAEQDRLEHQAVLVDQVVLDELPGERRTPHTWMPRSPPRCLSWRITPMASSPRISVVSFHRRSPPHSFLIEEGHRPSP